MEEWEIRAELAIDDDEMDIPDEFLCFWCSCNVDLNDGFWIESVSSEEAFGLTAPPESPGHRPSQRLRDFVRKRNLRSCAVCDRKLDWNECTVDHVKPWSRGGATEADNLVIMCPSCNKLKGDRDFQVQTVISPALLYPDDSEPEYLSPEELDDAVDHVVALFDCFREGVPLKDQGRETAKKTRLLRRQRQRRARTGQCAHDAD